MVTWNYGDEYEYKTKKSFDQRYHRSNCHTKCDSPLGSNFSRTFGGYFQLFTDSCYLSCGLFRSFLLAGQVVTARYRIFRSINGQYLSSLTGPPSYQIPLGLHIRYRLPLLVKKSFHARLFEQFWQIFHNQYVDSKP